MTEAKKEEVKQEEVKQEAPVQEQAAPELSPLEQEQYDAGWRPKEQWVAEGGDPDEWRSAREYKERGELYKSIHSTKKELKQAQTTISALQRHNKFIFDKAYQKAKNDLVKERRQALRENDVEKVDQIEQELEQLNTEHQQTQQEFEKIPPAQPEVTGVHPSFQAWLPNNRWYETNQELREYADFVGLKYSRDNPGTPPEEVLRHVTQRVRQQFPDKFGSRKAAPSPTAKPSNKSSTSKGSGISDDEIEAMGGNIEIMRTLINSKTLTREKYVEDLKQINERKR